MNQFTQEDVQYLMQKAGITADDAYRLLDYCGGDMAKALAELQKQGYVPNGGAAQETPVTASGVWKVLQRLYGIRVKIRRGETTVLNISVFAAVIGLIISWVAVLVGVVLAFLLGYDFSFDMHDPDFSGDTLRATILHRINSFKKSAGGTDA